MESSETANTIKAIDASTIHQIQSGQVIVDLCSVAKELVENSVDAGATSIEVRFKNQGLDSIEVQDNGFGIAPHNYEGLALKHYTSKLSTYDDLNTLQTFGFRGEALSSLCALSRFTVVTCQPADAPKGTKLEFEISGRLKGTSVVSAQKGTTVSVENLFGNLPVRRRELERNIKREWGKVVSLLNQYACIQTKLKFTLSQQPNKGKRIVLLSTKGNNTTRENILNVFGSKATSALIPLDLRLELEPTTGGPSLQATQQKDGETTEVHIYGHVSRPAHGEGRQIPDRQMFYINGRPCQLPQFAKVFNEVYKSYNTNQSPFIFADIRLDTHLYDVNVSPDKRTILLHDQSRMLENLRESLVELFEKQDITVPVSQLTGSKMPPFRKLTVDRATTSASESSRASRDKSTPGRVNSEAPASGQRDDEEENEPSGGSEADDESDAESRPRRRGKSSISNKSLTGDTQALNLITRWVERKTEDRADVKVASPRDPKISKKVTTPGLSRAQLANVADDHAIEPSDNAEDDLDKAGEEPEPVESVPSPIDEDDETRERSELPIPAITPTKSQAPRITNLSYSRPMKRPSQEVATITIGDHTVQSVIGSSWKRQRLDDDEEAPRSTSRSQKQTKSADSLPSFGGRLTQMFSATGSTQATDGVHLETASAGPSDGEGGSDDEDREDGGEYRSENEEGGSDDDVDTHGHEEEALWSEPKEVHKVHQEAEDEEEEESMFVDDEIPQEEPNPPAETPEDSPEAAQSPTSSADNIEEEPESGDAVDDHSSEGDQEYIDEDEKKAAEEARVQELVEEAEKSANKPTEDGQKRSQVFMKGTGKNKNSTYQYLQRVRTDEAGIRQQMRTWNSQLAQADRGADVNDTGTGLEAGSAEAEERLSLSISKADFGRMKIVGQFNLGFILAVREHQKTANPPSSSERSEQQDDELFIIDQHASDEKYNFERLQAQTVVQSQRLVQPKRLELTAMEEEIVIENQRALEANGFVVNTDTTGDTPVGSRCQLTSLPLSKETTFSLTDLEELIALLGDQPQSRLNDDGDDEAGKSRAMAAIPRPSRVRKMFAMRACRSSIMIGRALSQRQMENVVRHMGEMEKPWNCPHGRPTMRHLTGLGAWDERGWKEGDGFGSVV